MSVAYFPDILNVSNLPDGSPVVESILSYDWHIDTKYYTADVLLCTTEARTIGNQSFAESVQAFVVYFDSHEVRNYFCLTACLVCLNFFVFSNVFLFPERAML